MTWERDRLRHQKKEDQVGLPSSPDAVTEPPEDASGFNPDGLATNEAGMASRELAVFLLNNPGPAPAPTLLERLNYEDSGLMHPSELPTIRRLMSGPRLTMDGYLQQDDVWPIDLEDEEGPDNEKAT